VAAASAPPAQPGLRATWRYLVENRATFVPLFVGKAVLNFLAYAHFWIVPLFERTWGPAAGPAAPTAEGTALGTARGSFLRRWRLLAIDGFEVDVPDSKENAAEFK